MAGAVFENSLTNIACYMATVIKACIFSEDRPRTNTEAETNQSSLEIKLQTSYLRICKQVEEVACKQVEEVLNFFFLFKSLSV